MQPLTRKLPTRLIPFLFLLIGIIGCGGYDGPRPYAVKGKILVNGQPAAKAEVAFYPTASLGKTIVPQAVTDKDGVFQLSTYSSGDGAPVAEYSVTVFWPTYRQGLRRVGPDRLHDTYKDFNKTTLKAKVEAKTNELAPFDLQVENPLPEDPTMGGDDDKKKKR